MSDHPDLIDLIVDIRRELRELPTILSSSIRQSIKQGWRLEDRMDSFAAPPGPLHGIELLATSLSKAATLRIRIQEAYAGLDFSSAAPGHIGRVRRAVVLAGMTALLKGADGPEWLIEMIDSGRVRSDPEAMAHDFPELFADVQAAEWALTDLANDPRLWSL